MARPLQPRLTPSEGRRFGLTVGAAFLALAAIAVWRGHRTSPWILGGLGGALAVAGVLLPSRLGPVYRAWMRFGLALSKVTTPILMGLIYFIVLTPVGVLLRALGKNPLTRRESKGSFWRTRPPDQGGADSLTHQF